MPPDCTIIRVVTLVTYFYSTDTSIAV